MSKKFSEIRIGGLFHANGNDCQKMSTRTAKLLAYGRTFYFGKDEIVHAVKAKKETTPFNWNIRTTFKE